jgi:hypothetical protein
MKRLAIVGVVLALVGLLLAVAYWPLTSVSGAQLRTAEQGNGFLGYAVGARVTIHERVDNVSYASIFGPSVTVLWIDSGDPNDPIPVYVQGDARPVVTPGEVVYMPATLQQTLFGIEYWQVSTPSDVHAAWPIDAAFYGAVGLGVVCLAVDAVRSRSTTPQG